MQATVDAVEKSLSTPREALRFVDAVQRELGRVYVDHTAPEGQFLVYRRACEDARLIGCTPIVTFADRPSVSMLVERATSSTPMPEERCVLRMADGRAYLEITYDAHGAISKTALSTGDSWRFTRYADSRPFTMDPCARPGEAPPLGMLSRIALLEEAVTPDQLAALFVSSLDEATGALVLPLVDTPQPITATLHARIGMLRRHVHEPEQGVDPSWAIVWGDSFATGCFDELLELAMAALNDGQAPLLIPLTNVPTAIPGSFWETGFHRWARVVGDLGEIEHVLIRDERDGATCVGGRVIDVVDPWKLDAEVGAANERQRSSRVPRATPSITKYRVVDNARQTPVRCAHVDTARARDLGSTLRDDHAWFVSRYRSH